MAQHGTFKVRVKNGWLLALVATMHSVVDEILERSTGALVEVTPQPSDSSGACGAACEPQAHQSGESEVERLRATVAEAERRAEAAEQRAALIESHERVAWACHRSEKARAEAAEKALAERICIEPKDRAAVDAAIEQRLVELRDLLRTQIRTPHGGMYRVVGEDKLHFIIQRKDGPMLEERDPTTAMCTDVKADGDKIAAIVERHHHAFNGTFDPTWMKD